ncbi:hypothetical protein DFH27DRAFT_314072 [Peziza echinospora]|nr:hypothetical protein DFH27DRAFT_314072 [Peziza echinospora]
MKELFARNTNDTENKWPDSKYGYIPEYDHPSHTRGPIILGITITFLGISTTCVALRLYSRIRILRKMNIDDWLIVIAWIFCVVFSAYGCNWVKWGQGRLTKDIRLEWWQNFMKCSFLYGVIYMPTIMFTKLSIICFYLRLSPYRLFHWICFFMIGIILSWGVGFTFTSTFMCSPIKAAWEIQPYGTRVTCINLKLMGLVLAVSNAIIDTIILLLPIPMIWHLKLSTRKKLAVYALLGLGGFVCAVSIVRVTLVTRVFVSFEDVFYKGAIIAIWTAVEVNVGIVCACLPAIRHLYNVIFPASGRNSDMMLEGHNKSPYGQGPLTDATLVDTPSVVLPAVVPSEQIRNTDPCAPMRNANLGALDGETDVESLNANSMTWTHPHSQESIIPRQAPV